MPGGRHEGQSRTGLEPTRMLHELRQPPRASLGELIILVSGQPSQGPAAALGPPARPWFSGNPPLPRAVIFL